MKRIKKILASLMVAVMVLTAAPLSGFVGMKLNLDWLSFDWLDFSTKASAATYSGKCGESLTWSLDRSTGELVISGEGEMTDYSYPSDVPWYSYHSSIKKVTIGDGVTSIGSSAFYYFTNLTSITIPDSVTSIGSAFWDCTSLTSITIPDSVTSIDSSAFYNTGYYNDSSNWEDSVLYIGNHLIDAKINLSGAYTIKEGTKCIADEAFYGCTSLTSITIGNSVTSIGSSAFRGCTGLTSITIPDSVTSIGDYAFWSCTNLTSIKIGDSVTSIGSEAFYNCKSLTSITIPDSVTSIGSSAFGVCYNLTSITIPDSVTSIGSSAFRGCTGLTSITIPDSVTSIGSSAFNNTGYYNNSSNWEDSVLYVGNHLIEAKTSISGAYTIKEGTMSISSSAFRACTSLTSITIPDGVTSIGSSAFYDCTSLTSITIPDSVTSIGGSAFSYCTRLASITIPDSVTSIGISAFEDCTSLKSVTIPDSVTSIGNWVFQNCTRLTSITIPDSVTSIGDDAFESTGYYNNSSNWEKNVLYIGNHLIKAKTNLSGAYTIKAGTKCIANYAFEDCTRLTSVTIPDSVTSIGSYAFRDCTSLTDVYYIGTQEQWNAITVGSGNDSLTSATIHFIQTGKCGDNLTWSFDTTTGELVISGTGAMYDYDFYKCPWESYKDSIKTVVIGNDVTTIGIYAFYDCDSLTSVIIPDSVTSIGSSAFRECTNLTSITIPDSVTSIGSSAFYNTGYYNDSSNWEDDVLYIGNYLINVKSSLSGTYTIKGGTKCIADYAFYDCTSLTSITIPDSVTSIGSSAFSSCDRLTSVTIGNSVTSIGDWAFGYCGSLTSITIPDSVTSIGSYAFRDCTSLTSITIPDSVTSIGSSAFSYCDSLTSINVDTDNEYYSNDSFGVLYNKNKTELIQYPAGNKRTEFTIQNGVTSIGNLAFANCYSLTSITIPDSVTSIGDGAFYSCFSLTSIIIPDSVTSIGSAAFRECTTLTSITIPDSVTSIGNLAFADCYSLTSVTVGNSVTSIGKYAFDGCKGLTTVHYNGTQEQWDAIEKSVHGNGLLTSAELHFLKIVQGEAATCEKDGLSDGLYCSECDKYLSGHEVIPALGHDYHETVEQSSCTASGLKYKKCSRCESVIDRETIPALGHNPEYFKVDPTCKEAGYECYKCTNCGTEYMREELDVIDHISGDWEIVETATCSEDGYKIKKCTMCGEETHRETIPATGHSYEESIVTEPTCEGVGTKRFTCSVCGDSYDEEIAANGHKIKVIRKEPTCTSLGNEQSLCEVCGNMIGEMIFIPKLPHNYTEKVIAEPTCVKDGTKRYTCSSCGDSYDETLPATGEHKINIIRKEPTCTSVGYEQYLCETCGNMIGDMVFLPKLPHTYGEWTVVKDPTATEEGSKEHSCTVCGKTETVAIPAIGFETADGVTVDLEKNIISGFNAGVSSLDSYTTIVNENYVWEYEAANGKLGTGSKAILKDGDTVIGEYTILVYGDTTGDSWYDGQDAIIVDCLANGMLTKEDVGEAVYMAADCNHDGVIDQLDVALLNQAGTLLSNVDQSKPAEVLLETSAEYVEYLDLIDQSFEIETEEETEDIPEADAEETPETDTDVESEDTTPEQNAKIDIFEMIINFIKSIFEMLLSYIPMPLK